MFWCVVNKKKRRELIGACMTSWHVQRFTCDAFCGQVTSRGEDSVTAVSATRLDELARAGEPVERKACGAPQHVEVKETAA